MRLTFRKSNLLPFVFLILIVLSPILTQAADFVIEDMVGENYYLGTNIHFFPGKIWADAAIKTPGGEFIPQGTRVKIIMVKTNKKSGKSDITFIVTESGQRVRYKVENKIINFVSAKDHVQRIFVSEQEILQEKTSDLSAMDQKGIKEGRILQDMSRTAVLAAIGYPPEFIGPETLKKDCWRYWSDEKKSFEVCFDNSGKVTTTH